MIALEPNSAWPPESMSVSHSFFRLSSFFFLCTSDVYRLVCSRIPRCEIDACLLNTFKQCSITVLQIQYQFTQFHAPKSPEMGTCKEGRAHRDLGKFPVSLFKSRSSQQKIPCPVPKIKKFFHPSLPPLFSTSRERYAKIFNFDLLILKYQKIFAFASFGHLVACFC